MKRNIFNLILLSSVIAILGCVEQKSDEEPLAMQKWTTSIADATSVISSITENTKLIVLGSMREVNAYTFDLNDILVKDTSINKIWLSQEQIHERLPPMRELGIHRGIEKTNSIELKLEHVTLFYLSDIARSLRALEKNEVSDKVYVWLDLSQIKGLIDIQKREFADCKLLLNVSLPNGLKKIDSFAFSHCSALKRVSLPGTLEEIGGSVFTGCDSLSEILFEGSRDQWWTDVKKNDYWLNNFPVAEIHCADGTIKLPLLSINKNVLLGFRSNTESKIEIPKGVEEMRTSFVGCNNLKTLIIPSSVKKIDSDVFHYFRYLECIKFEGSVEEWKDVKVMWNSTDPDTTIRDKEYIFSSLCPNSKILCSDGVFPENTLDEM